MDLEDFGRSILPIWSGCQRRSMCFLCTSKNPKAGMGHGPSNIYMPASRLTSIWDKWQLACDLFGGNGEN